MEALKYSFYEHVKVSGSRYIFQSVTKQKLSNIYHSHDFYELLLLLDGSVRHCVNGSENELHEGDCVILTPQDAHRFTGQSEQLALIALSVQPEEFAAIAGVYGIELPLAQAAEPFSCRQRLSMLRAQAEHCCFACADNENRLLLSMLLSSFSSLQSAERSATPAALSGAVARMRSDEMLCGGIGSLTALTSYSYPHLYRLIRRYYGITPHALVLRLRLESAHSKLLHSDLSVEQIAASVGFCSTSHFTKVFTAAYAQTPSHLRKQTHPTCF